MGGYCLRDRGSQETLCLPEAGPNSGSNPRSVLSPKSSWTKAQDLRSAVCSQAAHPYDTVKAGRAPPRRLARLLSLSDAWGPAAARACSCPLPDPCQCGLRNPQSNFSSSSTTFKGHFKNTSRTFQCKVVVS